MFYISSIGHSASLWLSTALSSHQKIKEFINDYNKQKKQQ